MDTLYLAIINLLQALFPTDYASYINASGNTIVPIFRGYDNNIVPPTGDNYVIVTSIQDTNISLGFAPTYNSTTQQNTYTAANSTLFYVDLYGNNAEPNARVFNSVCQNGYANTYWDLNNYACTINRAKTPRNLTDIFGRDMYNKRFLVELEIFNNVSQTINIPNFNVVDFKLYLANSPQ